MSDIQFYQVNADGTYTFLGYGSGDDGCTPFDEEYTVSTDEAGCTVMKGDLFTITWTDCGAHVVNQFEYGSAYFPEYELLMTP